MIENISSLYTEHKAKIENTLLVFLPILMFYFIFRLCAECKVEKKANALSHSNGLFKALKKPKEEQLHSVKFKKD